MRTSVELMQAAYDDVAEDYDRLWTVHLRAPQARLTAALGLAPGMRCADLGCGTGVETLDMLRQVAPGEVVGVDTSPGMLDAARRRAAAEGLALTTTCEEADLFIERCQPASFDVITLRFSLGYLDSAKSLPRLPRLLRPGGRIGVIANLASSGRQAYATYQAMISEFGLPEVAVTAPRSIDDISAQLTRGGATIEAAWTHSFRLWFATGAEVARWLKQSGFATHPMLQQLPTDVVDTLWRKFAERVEAHREAQGLPLDFELAGVVAGLAEREAS